MNSPENAALRAELTFLRDPRVRAQCWVASHLLHGAYVEWTVVAPAEDKAAGLALYATRGSFDSHSCVPRSSSASNVVANSSASTPSSCAAAGA